MPKGQRSLECTPRWSMIKMKTNASTQAEHDAVRYHLHRADNDLPAPLDAANATQRDHSTVRWSELLRRHQFPTGPTACNRMLLVEDDLTGQGLGMTSDWLSAALLWAVKEGRVLREVPVDRTWNPTCVPPWIDPRPLPDFVQNAIPPGKTLRNMPKHLLKGWRREGIRCSVPPSGAECRPPCAPANLSRPFHYLGHASSPRPRWCTMHPHTHECFYKRWTHCPIPPEAEHRPPFLGRSSDIRVNAEHHASTRVLRVKLTWVFASASKPPGGSRPPEAHHAAVAFLFRPRTSSTRAQTPAGLQLGSRTPASWPLSETCPPLSLALRCCAALRSSPTTIVRRAPVRAGTWLSELAMCTFTHARTCICTGPAWVSASSPYACTHVATHARTRTCICTCICTGPWVSELARCTLRQAGVAAGDYVSVHVRDSAEKNKELRRWGHSMVSALASLQVTQRLSQRLDQPAVHVQTASPSALVLFEAAAARHAAAQEHAAVARGGGLRAAGAGARAGANEASSAQAAGAQGAHGGAAAASVLASKVEARHPRLMHGLVGPQDRSTSVGDGGGGAQSRGLRLVYTDFGERSEHDAWGGWRAGEDHATIHASLTAAVNLQLAVQSSALISPTFSMWTNFLLQHTAIGGASNATSLRARMLCCGCWKKDLGSNLMVVPMAMRAGIELPDAEALSVALCNSSHGS